MDYIFSDSLGGTYVLRLPLDGRDGSAKLETAKAYRRHGLQATRDAVPTLLRVVVDGQQDELAEAA